jgi:hypothetical protein
MLDLRSSTLQQLALVKPHTKANTDQNCSFEKAKIIIVPLVFLDADSMLTSFDTTRRNADGER